ncbi:MAG TPA: hypothetical protein VK797_29170 [Tepidisphaeraceae bacterium]|jgi:hypothetical protein|nr:hypothetical protein [Tepidisphaeraceae bacterium]
MRKGILVCFAIAMGMLGQSAFGQAPTATATFTSQALAGSQWQYNITVTNTSASQTIGTYWFSWQPTFPADFMSGPAPTNIVSPAFWSANLEGSGNSSDGYSIQWVASSPIYYIPAGGQMQFSFDSTLSPQVLAGDSTITNAGSTPVGTSYVYHAGVFSDAGTNFTTTPAAVPEPVSLALVGATALMCLRRRIAC